jgi:hypothetical protein
MTEETAITARANLKNPGQVNVSQLSTILANPTTDMPIFHEDAIKDLAYLNGTFCHFITYIIFEKLLLLILSILIKVFK